MIRSFLSPWVYRRSPRASDSTCLIGGPFAVIESDPSRSSLTRGRPPSNPTSLSSLRCLAQCPGCPETKLPKPPYTVASPPLRISEPKLTDASGRFEQAPSVTIVRTPQEALIFLQQDKVPEDSFEFVDTRPKRALTSHSTYGHQDPQPSPRLALFEPRRHQP